MVQQYKARRKMSARDNFLRARSNWRRFWRLVFPSPAEVKFVHIMRGYSVRVPYIRSTLTNFPLTFVWRGKVLRRELLKREVRIGRFYVDFGADTDYYKKAIECDGSQYHFDVVREMERDQYLKERGWQILHIRASQLCRNPDEVRRRTIKFLEK